MQNRNLLKMIFILDLSKDMWNMFLKKLGFWKAQANPRKCLYAQLSSRSLERVPMVDDGWKMVIDDRAVAWKTAQCLVLVVFLVKNWTCFGNFIFVSI